MHTLVVMAFDGETKTEGEFDSVEAAWARDDDMGSRWYFYPFHLVVDEDGKVEDCADEMSWTKGMTLADVSARFAEHAARPEMQGADVLEFVLSM